MLFFFQAEDGIRDLVRSRGLGDVYKRQDLLKGTDRFAKTLVFCVDQEHAAEMRQELINLNSCLLYTSDAADERSSVDLGGRRIIKKKNKITQSLHKQADKKQDDVTSCTH